MTKGDLMKVWKGIPSSAEIFVEADHGQQPESAMGIEFTQEDIDDLDRQEIEEIRWKNIKPSTKLNRITAILIR